VENENLEVKLVSVEKSPDLFIQGGTLLNVYSGELLKANVAVKGERILYVGPGSPGVAPDTRILKVEGRTLVPGYIDPHFHPWFVYNPVSFGQTASPRGTTTLFCDNLMFYMLMGPGRFERFMESLTGMPLTFYWFCRAVPQTPMEDEKALFSVENVERLLRHPAVRSLGEITRWKALIQGDEGIEDLIGKTKALGKRVDGHTAGAKYAALNSLARAGVESCHESINAREMVERLRLGFYVMLRENSLRQDLQEMLKAVRQNRLLTDRMMLTSDSASPQFYEAFGVTDHLIHLALQAGIDPVTAYRMATINPAVYFGLDHEIGGVAPGRLADVLVLKDLNHPTPEMVVAKGRLAAKEEAATVTFPSLDWEAFFAPSPYSGRRGVEPEIFSIPSAKESVRFPTMHLVSTVITRLEWVEFPVKEGILDLGGHDDYAFLAVLDRSGKWVSHGLISGLGQGFDGLAATFNTAAQIVAIGRRPEAMAAAASRLYQIEGGIVAVEDRNTAFEWTLPLGGLMSTAPMAELAHKDRELQAFFRRHGYPFDDPLYTLVFLPNDFLPQIRVNYLGVLDIRKNEVLWPRMDLPNVR